MEIVFYRHANKTHFHKKGCAASLILKARVFGSRKWPIRLEKDVLYRFLFFFFPLNFFCLNMDVKRLYYTDLFF